MGEDNLGLQRGIVKLSEYNPSWKEAFLSEKKKLQATLGDILAIEHVGSTSIPGIKAKPILDLMVDGKLKSEIIEVIK